MGVLGYRFGLSFLTGPPSLRLLPPALFITSTATATHSPSFFFFHCQHPRTVVALDGLNALSDAIALYHNNDRLSGTLPFVVRRATRYANRSPACLSRQPLCRPCPLPPPTPGSNGNVSFQTNERRDGCQPLDNGRQRHMFSVPRRSNTIRSCPGRGRKQL